MTGSMRLRSLSVGLAALLASAAGCAPANRAPPVDYRQASRWVCRPGKEEVCTRRLDAAVFTAGGPGPRERFAAARQPPVDCFYVYPTASRERRAHADLAETRDIDQVTRAEAGRLTARCRVFAPIYRQMTLGSLRQTSALGDLKAYQGAQLPDGLRLPYDDVAAAWRSYLAHDNGHRGVVLIGHSQGAILLRQLIAREIDGRPAQALLVSAFLAGDPGFSVAKGRRVGGAFQSVPLCAAAAETGCAYVWADYLSGDAAPRRQFGRDLGAGLAGACVNPAAPLGGPGALEPYLRQRAMPPLIAPSWARWPGGLVARCVSDGQGAALRVSVNPGPYAQDLARTLQAYTLGQGWGLHVLDVNLVQGNILDLIALQIRTWQSQPGRPR